MRPKQQDQSHKTDAQSAPGLECVRLKNRSINTRRAGYRETLVLFHAPLRLAAGHPPLVTLFQGDRLNLLTTSCRNTALLSRDIATTSRSLGAPVEGTWWGGANTTFFGSFQVYIERWNCRKVDVSQKPVVADYYAHLLSLVVGKKIRYLSVKDQGFVAVGGVMRCRALLHSSDSIFVFIRFRPCFKLRICDATCVSHGFIFYGLFLLD